jgi:DNA-directed RNA polymerase subunit RPC12/RpoP
MSTVKCPGQDPQKWGPEAVYDVACKNCGEQLEFFKDELKRRCRKCGTMVFNDRMDIGCLAWCPSAEQCAGPDRAKLLEEAAAGGAAQKKALELLTQREGPAKDS